MVTVTSGYWGAAEAFLATQFVATLTGDLAFMWGFFYFLFMMTVFARAVLSGRIEPGNIGLMAPWFAAYLGIVLLLLVLPGMAGFSAVLMAALFIAPTALAFYVPMESIKGRVRESVQALGDIGEIYGMKPKADEAVSAMVSAATAGLGLVEFTREPWMRFSRLTGLGLAALGGLCLTSLTLMLALQNYVRIGW